MNQAICIFEDRKYLNFRPLVYFRPVYDLLLGTSLLREKIERNFSNDNIIYHCREYLEDKFKKDTSCKTINKIPENVESVLFINGRIIADENVKKYLSLKSNESIKIKGEIAFARVDKSNFNNIDFTAENIFEKIELNFIEPQNEIKTANYIWDLIKLNSSQIIEEFKNFSANGTDQNFNGSYLINPDNIFIDKNVSIAPCTVIDASMGPVIISKNVKIESHCSIKGPVFIGENSLVKTGANIYSGTSIGQTCKVSGEIEGSIIHSFSNKQHDGFLGHSYLGSWINIGAGTTTSDLKNNYSKIKLNYYGKQVDTDLQFLGLLMGDHSKTAINTTFNTGTIIGTSCNLFGNLFNLKIYPSFHFGDKEMARVNIAEKAIQVAEIVMSRRNIKFDQVEKELINTVFNLTENERT